VEASTLTHAGRRGLLGRRSPVLKLERDERLVALIRAGHEGAFDVLFNRYHARLLAFCASMLKSRQDAEDVLQEVFANAHAAMLADERKINVRPWLYRIARNRCLNFLRKPVPEGQDSMDIHPHMNGTTTAERVQKREELRHVLADVETLPETQKTALLLREIDQLSYEEIAVAMETTIPAVKSLLVRARITLAESSEARTLSCDEVRVTLAEAAEGIGKATGPVRLHVRDCEGCAAFREQLRSDSKALASLFPIGPLALLKAGLLGKLFGGGAAGGGVASTGGAAGAIGSSASAAAGGTAGGLGAIGGAIGTKAAAGVATAALLTAGAVEVRNKGSAAPPPTPAPVERVSSAPPQGNAPGHKDKLSRKLLKVGAGAATAGAAAEGARRAGAEQESSTEDGESSPRPAAQATGAEAGQSPAEGETSSTGNREREGALTESFEGEATSTPAEGSRQASTDGSEAGEGEGSQLPTTERSEPPPDDADSPLPPAPESDPGAILQSDT
jgi:RNA polymerase sigma factor (sigma-70 family)